jgi:predicted ATPase
MIFQGWALAAQGQVEAGRSQMRRGLDAYKTQGALARSYFLALLAATYGNVCQVDVGLRLLDEALPLLEQHDERWWEAELYRIRGGLLLSAACGVRRAEWTPEACFHQALEVARRQQAKSLELRAASSLARLWQSQDKHQEAHDLLAPVYNWFTEGFDTADLQEAKALLQALA